MSGRHPGGPTGLEMGAGSRQKAGRLRCCCRARDQDSRDLVPMGPGPVGSARLGWSVGP